VNVKPLGSPQPRIEGSTKDGSWERPRRTQYVPSNSNNVGCHFPRSLQRSMSALGRQEDIFALVDEES